MSIRSRVSRLNAAPKAQLQTQIKNNDAIEFEFNYYW